MENSSEEDVLHRTRRNVHSRGYRRYESESISSDEASPEFGQLFYTYFGNGDEYEYIYDEEKGSGAVAITEENRDGAECFDAEEVYEYLRQELPPEGFEGLSKDMIEMIRDGYSPEYISVYHNSMGLRECYSIMDFIKKYKEDRRKVKDIYKTFEDVNELGLLTLSEYAKNIEERERIYEPHGEVQSNEWGDETNKYEKVIHKMAQHPTFTKAVERCELFGGMGIKGPKESLIRLYCTAEWDEGNEVRRMIVEKAYERAAIDREGIKRLLASQGYEGDLERSINLHQLSLRNLTNLIYSIQGRDGVYGGVFLDNGFCKCVTIDTLGRVTARSSFKVSDTDGIQAFLSAVDTICITSNTAAIRQFMQRLNIPMLYVPRSFSLFSDEVSGYSIPCDIARIVQNPLVYFSRYFSQGLLFKRAISIAAMLRKPDWSHTLKYYGGECLFGVLDIKLNNEHFDYTSIRSLQELERHFSESVFANIGTFFSLSSSDVLFDGTHIHPKHYSLAGIICKGYANAPTVEDGVREVFANTNILKALSLSHDEYQSVISYGMRPDVVRKMIMGCNNATFSGAPDWMIFDDVVPYIDTSLEHTGMIVKDGPNFYLVDVGGAMVFVKKEEDVPSAVINQLVTLRLTGHSPHMLSYIGEMVAEKSLCIRQFTLHRLYRQGGQEEIEDILREEGMNILIRSSSSEDSLVAVCRITDSLFFSYRLQEVFNDGNIAYKHGNTFYSSIDHFFSSFVTPLYKILKSVRSFKYFYPSRDAAYEYLRTPGTHVKYAICLSQDRPGFLEFLYKNKRVLARIDHDGIQYKDFHFASLAEFIVYAKQNFH